MFQDCNHYIIQGHDYKARCWMRPFGEKAHFFVSARDLLKCLGLSGRKSVVFRYMNSDAQIMTDIKYTILIFCICVFRSFFRVQIFWILHNIDRETVDTFPLLTQIRRRLLMWASKRVFVTDKMFKERFFPDVKKVEAISFGPKRDGAISADNLEKITRLRQRFDVVVLCLGASGQKYEHFNRLVNLADLARKSGSTIVFILPMHTQIDGLNCLNIIEPNIDEETIAPHVDFIYRINDDISMPYTIYAACGAQIPIVTAQAYFTYDIVTHYGIGFDEAGFFVSTPAERQQVKENMTRFLDQSDWRSLSIQILLSQKKNVYV